MTVTYRTQSAEDPVFRAALVGLVQEIFGIDLSRLGDLGGWPANYRAFSAFDGTHLVANVSLRPVPLMINGQRVTGAQIHAVATRPAYRHQGIYTHLITAVLAEADAQALSPIYLTTGTPPIYQPYGFRVLEEHSFTGSLQGTPVAVQTRTLDMNQPADLALLLRISAERTPPSQRIGHVNNSDVIAFDAAVSPDWTTTYLPAQDAILIWSQNNGGTQLIDIIAAEIPGPEVLAGVLGLSAGAEVEILFAPDRIPGVFHPKLHKLPDDYLMFRGEPVPQGPFMLPLSSEA